MFLCHNGERDRNRDTERERGGRGERERKRDIEITLVFVISERYSSLHFLYLSFLIAGNLNMPIPFVFREVPQPMCGNHFALFYLCTVIVT